MEEESELGARLDVPEKRESKCIDGREEGDIGMSGEGGEERLVFAEVGVVEGIDYYVHGLGEVGEEEGERWVLESWIFPLIRGEYCLRQGVEDVLWSYVGSVTVYDDCLFGGVALVEMVCEGEGEVAFGTVAVETNVEVCAEFKGPLVEGESVEVG